jgi:phospholipid N-methyltransferase
MASSDAWRFLRALVRDPTRVGAVAPSGRSLAKQITADITPSHAPVLELGPGTGVLTEALVARGVPEQAIALVEADPGFAERLAIRFPHARILAMDATGLGDLPAVFDEPAGAVVSGLPLLSIPAEKVLAILRGAFSHLRPGGALYQFTYLPRCPVPSQVMQDLGLESRRVSAAWLNLPPAFVYRIRVKRVSDPRETLRLKVY